MMRNNNLDCDEAEEDKKEAVTMVKAETDMRAEAEVQRGGYARR